MTAYDVLIAAPGTALHTCNSFCTRRLKDRNVHETCRTRSRCKWPMPASCELQPSSSFASASSAAPAPASAVESCDQQEPERRTYRIRVRQQLIGLPEAMASSDTCAPHISAFCLTCSIVPRRSLRAASAAGRRWSASASDAHPSSSATLELLVGRAPPPDRSCRRLCPSTTCAVWYRPLVSRQQRDIHQGRARCAGAAAMGGARVDAVPVEPVTGMSQQKHLMLTLELSCMRLKPVSTAVCSGGPVSVSRGAHPARRASADSRAAPSRWHGTTPCASSHSCSAGWIPCQREV